MPMKQHAFAAVSNWCRAPLERVCSRYARAAIPRVCADARVRRIYGGTNEIMKEVIARGMGLGGR